MSGLFKRAGFALTRVDVSDSGITAYQYESDERRDATADAPAATNRASPAKPRATAMSLEQFVDRAMEMTTVEPIDAQLAALDARELAPPRAGARNTAAFARKVIRALDRTEPEPESETAIDLDAASGDEADSDDASEAVGGGDDDDDDDDDDFVVRGDEAERAEIAARAEHDAMRLGAAAPSPPPRQPTMTDSEQPAAKKRAMGATNVPGSAHDAHTDTPVAAMSAERADAKTKQEQLRASLAQDDATGRRAAALRSYMAAIATDVFNDSEDMFGALCAALATDYTDDKRPLLLSTVHETLDDMALITDEINGALAAARAADTVAFDAIVEMIADAARVEVLQTASGDASNTDLEQCAVLGAPVMRSRMRELKVALRSGAAQPRYRVHKALAQLVVYVHSLREFHDVVERLVRQRLYKLRRKIKSGAETRHAAIRLLVEDATKQAVVKVSEKKLSGALDVVCRSAARIDEARRDTHDDAEAATEPAAMAEDVADDDDDGDGDDDDASLPLGADDAAYTNDMGF